MKVAKIRNMDAALVDVQSQVEADMTTILAIFGDECIDYVWEMWPAKTGKSIEAMIVEVSESGGVAIRCAIKHAAFIHLAGERGSALYSRLLPAIENNIKRITDKVTARLKKGEGRPPIRHVPAGLVASKIADSKARAYEAQKKRRALTKDERNRKRREAYAVGRRR